MASEAKTAPKKFWNHVNSKITSCQGVPDLINKDGGTVSKDKEKVQLLNDFFGSVYTSQTATQTKTAARNSSKMNEIQITPANALNKLKPNKSPGPDGIHAKWLTKGKEELKEPLLHIFQLLLEHGKLPTDWKTATVSPILKKGCTKL